MEKILIDNGFEKKGGFYIRNTQSKEKPELKSRIAVTFRNSYWMACVQFYKSGRGCGLGDFRYKSLKRLVNTLSKECGYCGF